ncbi:fimbrial protein [Siccibacter colletis]|uniref:fimbrial protein n=1 Tax=Siccibacter colletis TaxID=1505757 RepID=UPI0028BF0BEE|nr:fimbrial protein [Siccibacter colletis]WNN47067.1 fimbrial protein [Siccibacter colletis]
MKRNLIAVAFATVAALSASSVFAADGTVNFTGEIIDQACTVDIGTSDSLTVNLGKIAKSSFSAAGDDASTTKFTMTLKACPAAVTAAKVKFDGINDATDSSLLALTSETGVAKGVAIALMTADKADLGLNATNDYSYTLKADVDNQLDFYAAYRSTSDTVTAGKANSVATFSVNYN